MLLNDHALTCGSLFSGVGGMDIGLAWAGFRHVFFAEIDPYCRAVLATRFPGVHIYDDVRDVDRDSVRRLQPDGQPGDPHTEEGDGGRHSSRLDLLCGGFPCQDLSVAGKRAGLAGERSGLFHEFMRIADALRPRAILVENVEGLYSSNGGRDFGVVLNALAERGYLVSWRTLDAQHFGVPQRRRRVFVCAVLDGDPGAERIGEVLALQEGSDGDPPTSDPAWPLSAAGAGAGATGGGRTVGALTHTGGAMTMDHQSFVGAGQYVLPSDVGESRIVGCLTDPSRLDEQCVGSGQLITGRDIAPTVTAKWAKGSGGPSGSETGNLVVSRPTTALTTKNASDGGWHDNEDRLVTVERERERES